MKDQRGLRWKNSSLMISVVQLLQTPGFRHWNSVLMHSQQFVKKKCVTLRFGTCIDSERDFDIWMLIQTLSSWTGNLSRSAFWRIFWILVARPRERFAVWKQAMIQGQICNYLILLGVEEKFSLLLCSENCRGGLFPPPRVPLSAMSTQHGVGEEGEALGWVERAADVAAGLCGVPSERWFLLLWMPLGNAEASTCMLVLWKCGFYFLKWIVVPKKSFSFFKASSEKSNCMGWKWGDYSVCKESCTS